MSETVEDGATVELDPLDVRLFNMNWDDNLGVGVSIASQAVRINAVKPDGIAITSIARIGAVATVTTAAAHGYATNDWVSMEGANQSDYNVTAQVTVTGPTTFTYAVVNTPTTPATGTITAASGLGKDNASILSAAPYNSRYTQVRLIGGGAAALGRLFEVSTTIVTNESPTQTKDRMFRVLIADQ